LASLTSFLLRGRTGPSDDLLDDRARHARARREQRAVVVKTGEKRLAGGADDNAIREFASISSGPQTDLQSIGGQSACQPDRAQQIADCVSS
jgi:hypothetical protein